MESAEESAPAKIGFGVARGNLKELPTRAERCYCTSSSFTESRCSLLRINDGVLVRPRPRPLSRRTCMHTLIVVALAPNVHARGQVRILVLASPSTLPSSMSTRSETHGERLQAHVPCMTSRTMPTTTATQI